MFETIELLLNQPVLEDTEARIDIRQVLLGAFPQLEISEEALTAIDEFILDFHTLEFASDFGAVLSVRKMASARLAQIKLLAGQAKQI